MGTTDDPYDLSRFCEKHNVWFDKAIREIRTGCKQTCWSWYIFPVGPFVVDGEEQGDVESQQFALRDRPCARGHEADDAARAYLKFEADGVNLRYHYVVMMAAIADQLENGIAPITLVGDLDAPKLKS